MAASKQTISKIKGRENVSAAFAAPGAADGRRDAARIA